MKSTLSVGMNRNLKLEIPERANSEYRRDFAERMENWLAVIHDGRHSSVQMEMTIRRLHASNQIDHATMLHCLDLLETVYIALARGRQCAKWCRRYPPDLGHRWPLIADEVDGDIGGI